MDGVIMRTAVLAAIVVGVETTCALEPVDKALIPEARAVLDYLESVYGRQTLAASTGGGVCGFVYETSGKLPAIAAFDLSGWNSPTWGKSYTSVIENTITAARGWWDRGGIVAMQFHWKNPGKPDGSAWVGKHGNSPPSGPFDMGAVITAGTPAHEQFMDDLAKHADYLAQLAEARVPVLWRPFHEIDGGWFWWTDQETPENTAAAWRMMFEYLVKERKLHNLIWVYNPGVRAGGYHRMLRAAKTEGSLEAEIAFRKRYYPGPEYCDLAGIDIYPNKSEGYGSPTEDTFPKAMEIMRQVAPDKMYAMCESSAVVNPALMQKDGPRWLYSLQWFEGDPVYTRDVYNHAFLVTLDEIPPLNPEATPFAGLAAPQDGAVPAAAACELRIEAGARADGIARVEYLDIAGPWRNWWLMKASEKEEAFAKATRICVATTKPFAAVWHDAPSGMHNLAARIADTKGRTSYSNVARVSVGVDNLARGGTMTASSKPEEAARANDGSLFTAWGGDKEGEQWLAVDLGTGHTLRAVSVSWWKAYAKAFRVQVSADGASWRDVYSENNKRDYLGSTDIIRFEPVHARHVRLLCTTRGTTWGGYSVYELGVYEQL